MAFTCAVLRSSSSSRKLTKWKVTMCESTMVEETVRYVDVTSLSGKKRKTETDFKLLSVS